MGNSGDTPMMRQYREVKADLPPGAVLLFRLGDFYEMFDEDAEVGARILGITLTQRHGQPMAGIPYHAAETYLGKFLEAGVKVAICEQIETPKPGKLVQRALTRILTPGTLLESNQLEPRENHYLVAVDRAGAELRAAWIDLTSGTFHIAADPRGERLPALLHSLRPREIIVPETLDRTGDLSRLLEGCPSSTLADHHFETGDGYQAVLDLFHLLSLDGFGIPRDHPALGAAGAILHYLREMLRHPPENLRRIQLHPLDETLVIDAATQRNLEIFQSAGGGRETSLLAAVDRCSTAAGSRLLQSWLAAPPLDPETIRDRHRGIAALVERPHDTGRIRDTLARMRDLQRILARLQNRIRNPRELGGIRDTLRELPEVIDALGAFSDTPIYAFTDRIHLFPEATQLLERALAEDLPGKLDEGGVIKDGYHGDLDHLRELARNSKSWLANWEKGERERTGIKNLRVKFNNAFGYFIEITKSNLAAAPEDYVRKQTMTNAERFTTPELKSREKEILHAEEKAVALEEELFRELVEKILTEAAEMEETATALAELDLLAGWSHLARTEDYREPEIVAEAVLEIEQGRHPVIEQQIRREAHGLAGTHAFVPNDCALSDDGDQIALITGPNMAGKSTYIRQVALIALLAQSGCWVPARSCRMGIVDRIFSRVGASDELARGNSTFMVEMNETANILHHCTPRSLIILDEIGRGTSTYDGLSIAWAVVEHLHGEDDRGPRTLFATHYHELTRLSQTLPRLKNFCVSVKEWNDEIVFVRQVIPGAADRSYGIQVARLAGLPEPVIRRARGLLEQLEEQGSRPRNSARKGKGADSKTSEPTQLELF